MLGDIRSTRWIALRRPLPVVFNNPFGSFHDTVAEAKEEREQIDRLLTISTPRERLLVAAIAGVLLVLTAWLFFGSVARSLAADGLLVEPGQDLVEGSSSVQVLVRVERGVAPHIKAGMPALIEFRVSDEGADTVNGEVATISAVPLSGNLAALESVAPAFVYRVEIELDASLDPASLTSRECRIVIELGRQSPAALFRMRRS